MHELTASEVASAGGGMRPSDFGIFGVAFEAGYMIGTYIDQRWIAPLWR